MCAYVCNAQPTNIWLVGNKDVCDYTPYKLVFDDEFDGSELNRSNFAAAGVITGSLWVDASVFIVGHKTNMAENRHCDEEQANFMK